MHLISYHYRTILKLLFALTLFLYVKFWFQLGSHSFGVLQSRTIKEYHPSDYGQNKATIKFVTYNMWCNYLVSCKANYRERFEGLAAGVQEFDVVMVQEVFILQVGPVEFTGCASAMVEAMERHGFHYRTSFTDTVPHIFGQSNGIAIFSKIPFHYTKSVVFKDAAFAERVNNKGFVFAEMKISGKQVFVFNTHTDAHKEEIRAAQMEQLRKTVLNLPKSAYFIVGGDFNINPNYPPLDGNEKEYLNLNEKMKKMRLVPVFTERNATHLNGGSYDYVFIDQKFKVQDHKVINLLTKNHGMVSDHYGLYIEIELMEK
ncbi:uncharacterized protein LOC5513669 [Nematostella vectensis]|uniref:uncharacterized protein LOC5513669 n=1 Tax=Nematostella vectensis TaxID=45351 RepID=UPI0020775D0B|nr:uncharacterized protein LOC5513669 [Nematostella vectensis]